MKQAREQWHPALADEGFEPEDVVVLDEFGATTQMTRAGGRCPIGERLVAPVPHGHWRVLTTIAAMTVGGMLAAVTVDAATDADVFRAFVRDALVPALRPGQLVVMDNLSSHKVPGVVELIESAGCRVRYLPPYSPDLNPIENAFSTRSRRSRRGSSASRPARSRRWVAPCTTRCREHHAFRRPRVLPTLRVRRYSVARNALITHPPRSGTLLQQKIEIVFVVPEMPGNSEWVTDREVFTSPELKRNRTMKTLPITAATNARVCELHPLESRRLFAVDLIPFTSLLPGAYAQGDVIPVIVTVDNLKGTTATPSAVSYKAVLTKDQTIGNADDIVISEGSFDPIPANNGDGIQTEIAITGAMAAGDYFLAMQCNVPPQFAETNTENNVLITDKLCRITTEQLTNPTILGTAGNDLITIEQHSDNDVVTVNGVSYYYDYSETAFDHLFIDGGSGNDKILVIDERVSIDLFITGSGGNDTIQGGNGDDELSGANGKDKIFGGSGDDYLLGGASADYLTGGHGDDTMSGAGGNDRLTDHFNKDYFLGGAGNDVFITRDAYSDEYSDPDTISGGAGTDRAQADSGPYTDLTASIEELLA